MQELPAPWQVEAVPNVIDAARQAISPVRAPKLQPAVMRAATAEEEATAVDSVEAKKPGRIGFIFRAVTI